jgi:hypothetical protein
MHWTVVTVAVGEGPAIEGRFRASGLAIAKDGGELTLSIRGTPVAAEKGAAALLACLIENIGCVVSFERLALAVGCKSGDLEGRRHVLRQHVFCASRLLAVHQTPYVITAATNLGYALCKIAAPPTGRR